MGISFLAKFLEDLNFKLVVLRNDIYFVSDNKTTKTT